MISLDVKFPEISIGFGVVALQGSDISIDMS